MAHKKGVGSSRNGRDSNPQFRGVKKFGGERVRAETSCAAVRHQVAPGRNVGWAGFHDLRLDQWRREVRHKNRTPFKVSVYAP